MKWAIGCEVDGRLVGAAIAGRPVARGEDAGQIELLDPLAAPGGDGPFRRTAEVLRLVTNGHPNACSKLYAACARIAEGMGYERIQTYILASEPGTSLRAAGWEMELEVRGRDWNTPSRGGRRTDQPMVDKQRWAKILHP